LKANKARTDQLYEFHYWNTEEGLNKEGSHKYGYNKK